MPKYRKKPVVIEARQFDGSLESAQPILEWIGDARPAEYEDGHMLIKTLEGEHRADPGDWIIRGVQGEFYPCKPDIFTATYDPAEEATT